MSLILNSKTAKRLAIVADGFDVHETSGNNFIIGSMIKFDDDVYIVSKAETMPLDTVLVALGIITAWVRWWDGLPAEHRVTQPGQFHRNEKIWVTWIRRSGRSGNLGLRSLERHPLSAPDRSTVRRDYTFVTDTAGGRIAIGELKSAIRNVRTVRPGAVRS